MSFFAELKRRNVFKVAAAYIITSWLVAQVAELAADSFGAPDWVMKMFITLLVLGLPFAVIFAWAFEMTPEGLKKEKEVDQTQSITNITGQKLNNTIIGVLVLALGYFAIDKFVLDRHETGSETISAQTSGQTAVADEKVVSDPDETEPVISRQSIAVLPFDNRSRVEDDEFFVEGVHDDLLTNLARIGALKVISRTSVLRYKDTELPIPEIATALGVATIMEGAVQRSGNTVRINVQLIDAQTDEHLWAEIYDRELTAENLFAIQSEISRAIADALQATLSPDELDRINTAPTENLQAHDAFLRGRQLIAERTSDSLEQAVLEFTKAVELDPQFALAWVGLAESRLLLPYYGTQSVEETIPPVEQAINRALAINDQLGEAYASLAEIHYFYQRYEEAEAAYLKAIELSPNYAPAWQWYAGFLSDFPLRIQEAVDSIRKAVELDPSSAILNKVLADRYRNQGLYSLAERQYRKVMRLEPDFAATYRALADLYQFDVGQYEKALPLYLQAQELDPGNLNQLENLAGLYLEIGNIDAATHIRDRMAELDADHVQTGFADLYLNLRQGNPAGAREAIDWLTPRADNEFDKVWLANLSLAAGDSQSALELYLSASPGWQEPAQWPDLIEHFATHACNVSWLFLNEGKEQLGSDLLLQTTIFLDESLPAVMEHADTWHPEVCHLTAGDTEKALATIETQLDHGHITEWWWIHDMPMFKEIKFNSRYQALVEEHERTISQQRKAVEELELEADL